MQYVVPHLSLEQINDLRFLVAEKVCQEGEKVVKNIMGRKTMVKMMGSAPSSPAPDKQTLKATFDRMNEEELQRVKDWSILLRLLNDASGTEKE